MMMHAMEEDIRQEDHDRHRRRKKCTLKQLIWTIIVLVMCCTGAMELGFASVWFGTEDTSIPVDFIMDPLAYAIQARDKNFTMHHNNSLVEYGINF
jgi:hypothetical protein